MAKLLVGIAALAIATLLLVNPTHACTDFRLKAIDGTLLITRSMEFGTDLHSNLRTSQRGREITSTTPSGKPGLSWKAKYGYVMVDGFGLDAALDGMNEAGLSFEFLYLPGETQYQTVPSGQEDHAVSYVNFGDWVLGNFQTIKEVKQALANIYVVSQAIPSMGNFVLPGHAAIYDATGQGIVVEFYDNKINIYDNIGIMTNSPKYDWQVTNLRNYLNLSPYTPNPLVVEGIAFSATGQGAGSVGLPGDSSPPSRFVKTAFMVKNIYQPKVAADALNLAEHIMNNVDLPAGYSRAINQDKETTDITQWVVFKDLTHKIFYYRTYNNLTIRSIVLSKLDFTERAARLKMPLAEGPYTQDITVTFANTK